MMKRPNWLETLAVLSIPSAFLGELLQDLALFVPLENSYTSHLL